VIGTPITCFGICDTHHLNQEENTAVSITIETNESAAQDALERQAVLALSVMHLWKTPFTPTAATTKADLVAVEADYDTYAEKTLTAWFAPILAPSSGYIIESPLVQFGPLATTPVQGNIIGGYWIEDAAGIVRQIVTFDQPANMQVLGQGIPVNAVVTFPAG
jgi:hypothetical protein